MPMPERKVQHVGRDASPPCIIAISAPDRAGLIERFRRWRAQVIDREDIANTRPVFDARAPYRLSFPCSLERDWYKRVDDLARGLELLPDDVGVHRLGQSGFLGVGRPDDRLGVLFGAPTKSDGQSLSPFVLAQYQQTLSRAMQRLGWGAVPTFGVDFSTWLGLAYRRIWSMAGLQIHLAAGEGLGERSALALCGYALPGSQIDPTRDHTTTSASARVPVLAGPSGKPYATDIETQLDAAERDRGYVTRQLQRLIEAGATTIAVSGPQFALTARCERFIEQHGLVVSLIEAQRVDTDAWLMQLAEWHARGMIEPAGLSAMPPPAYSAHPIASKSGPDHRIVRVFDEMNETGREAVYALNRSQSRATDLHAAYLRQQQQVEQGLERITATQARLTEHVAQWLARPDPAPMLAERTDRSVTQPIRVTEIGHRSLIDIARGAEFWVIDHGQALGTHLQDALRIHRIPARLVDPATRPRGQRISGLLIVIPNAVNDAFLNDTFGLIEQFNATLDVTSPSTVVFAQARSPGLGRAPLSRAMTGLAEAAPQLCPWSSVKFIEFDSVAAEDYADLAAEITDEVLLAGPSIITIKDTGRFAQLPTPSPLPSDCQPVSLRTHDTIVVVGTPDSVAMGCAISLARQTGCALSLIAPTPGEPTPYAECINEHELRSRLAREHGLTAATGLEDEVRRVLRTQRLEATLESLAAAGIRTDFEPIDTDAHGQLAQALSHTLSRVLSRHTELKGLLFDVGALAEIPAHDACALLNHRLELTQICVSRIAERQLTFLAGIQAGFDRSHTLTDRMTAAGSLAILDAFHTRQPQCVTRWLRLDRSAPMNPTEPHSEDLRAIRDELGASTRSAPIAVVLGRRGAPPSDQTH